MSELIPLLNDLVWLGHDSFCLSAAGKTIYFDPFRLAGEFVPADIIFVSHEHYDHCSPEDIAKLLKPETIIVTEPMSAVKLSADLDIRTMRPGEHLQIDNVGVTAVPAYNTNKKFHPKENNWLGFIIDIDGGRIYHAGDTDYIPEMKGIEVDIALLPVSGTYTMTAKEAVLAALDINPQVVIPMHHGSLVGKMDDGREFMTGVAGRIQVKLVSAP